MADSPAELRAAFRSGESGPTSGLAPGHAQANLLVVSTDWAYDVLLFAQRNRDACPVLDVTDAGSPGTPLAPGADLRTDLPRYRVWRDGRLADEPTDVTDVWRDDLVAFLVGCSFTFDTALTRAGLPWRYPGRNVSMYVTDQQCRAAGRVHGPLVVSMRPVPEASVDTAVRITTLMPASHGAPVHIGDPAELGIADVASPDFGERAMFEPGDVPMFWACGVTLQAAVMASRPEFAITHAPGHMFITDVHEQT
ncbi:putative hydro-lyase [Catenulispora subtropica]|uniref:Hydro-lyase n=1 Tax=Catenulispora subtropica TaxID=450798 RepID=A0ABN2SBE1_9ACTN